MPEAPVFPAWTFKPGPQPSARETSTTVVLLTAGPPDEEWMRRVSKDEEDAVVVFLEPIGDAMLPRAWAAGSAQPPASADVDLALAVAAQRARKTGAPDVRFTTPSGQKQVHETHAVAMPADRPAVETTILSEPALEARIKVENVDAINNLVRQLRSPLGVIPLVGAGMSAAIQFHDPPARFPQWGELLLKMAAGTSKASDIADLVAKGDYEGAAKTLDDHRPGVLPQRIRDAFDRTVDDAQLRRGALSYLPFIARGPVITTNFDHVLEQVFAAAEQPFGEKVIRGPQSYALIQAVHANERGLLKIHGDCRDPTFRIFTVEEYERNYGVASRAADGAPPGTATIGSLAWLMFSNRPLLCLGCSLEEDRTTNVLRALRRQLPGLTHYAILAGHYSLRRWEERTKRLDEMGIRPLWFAPERFAQIETLLRDALERSSTRSVARITPLPDASVPRTDGPEAVRRFRAVGDLIRAAPATGLPGQLLQLITRALLDGKLAFFLGAWAHLGNLPLGNAFYDSLTRKFKCPPLIGDRTAVAAFIVSRYGPTALWHEVRAVVGDADVRPSALHRLLASLPALLRATNRPQAAPLWIFTTNYDALMEEALTAAGEPFHLLYYIGGTATRNEGLFAERAVDGSVRVIERPDNMRTLDAHANVLVKLNGGLVDDGSFEESVLIAASHFERLAAQIPQCLPVHLRNALREKSLLFLGHGLAESDVHALIKYSAPADRTIKSWAIQLPPGDGIWRDSWKERAEFWRGWGLQIVPSDLEAFLAALHQEWSAHLITGIA